MSQTREEIQQQALQAWIANDCNGAVIVGTGVGKTKVAIDAIQYFIHNMNSTNKILWLTNSERLRDVDTKEDFTKWGVDYSNIQFECIQTAYKWVNKSYNLVVVDEGDFMLTPEYSKFFENNHYSYLLFLTATVDKSKQQMLDSLCPTVYKYSTVQAQEDDILNKSSIVIANYMLDSSDKYIMVNGKGGKSFYQTENDAYAYLEKRCIAELLAINKLEKEISLQAVGNLDLDNTIDYDNQLKKAYATHKFWTNKRANFLWQLRSSRSVTRCLLASGQGISTNKFLVFSKRTEQAEQISPITYHAKNAKDNTALDDLSSGKISLVGVVQAVNRGVNISGLTHLIFESYDGSKTSFQQRYGRGTRLDKSLVNQVVILVPYYKDKEGKVKATQAAKWVKDMTEGFTINKEVWI